MGKPDKQQFPVGSLRLVTYYQDTKSHGKIFSIAKKRVTISTGYTIILLSAGLRLELFFVIHRSFKISRAEAESAKTSTSADVSAGTLVMTCM